jgi:hypothetical protein
MQQANQPPKRRTPDEFFNRYGKKTFCATSSGYVNSDNGGAMDTEDTKNSDAETGPFASSLTGRPSP